MVSDRKIEFVFPGVTLTLTPADIEAVQKEWERDNPGKKGIEMTSAEFADRCMAKLEASAVDTRN